MYHQTNRETGVAQEVSHQVHLSVRETPQQTNRPKSINSAKNEIGFREIYTFYFILHIYVFYLILMCKYVFIKKKVFGALSAFK